MKESASCRLSEVADDSARIEGTVKLTPLTKTPQDGAAKAPVAVGGTGLQVELVEGAGRCDFRISRKDGLIRSATVTMLTRMTADNPMGGEMSMTHETKSSVERLALAPTTPSPKE